MINFFRVISIQDLTIPGKPRWEIVVARGPLRIEERRVLIHQEYLRQLEPSREHRLQKVAYE